MTVYISKNVQTSWLSISQKFITQSFLQDINLFSFESLAFASIGIVIHSMLIFQKNLNLNKKKFFKKIFNLQKKISKSAKEIWEKFPAV